MTFSIHARSCNRSFGIVAIDTLGVLSGLSAVKAAALALHLDNQARRDGATLVYELVADSVGRRGVRTESRALPRLASSGESVWKVR